MRRFNRLEASHTSRQTGQQLLVLIPSPLLGPYSWSLVAEELNARGRQALVSVDLHKGQRRQPHWRATVVGVETCLREVAADRPVVLVAHSGAGPLLPAIGTAVLQPVGTYLFVDAGLPNPGVSQLEAIAAEDPAFAADLRADLDAGRRFPAWTDEDLHELVPDPDRRRALLAELRPRAADFWTESLPEVNGWPDAPCGYLLFSAAYQSTADRARRAGWPTRRLSAVISTRWSTRLRWSTSCLGCSLTPASALSLDPPMKSVDRVWRNARMPLRAGRLGLV